MSDVIRAHYKPFQYGTNQIPIKCQPCSREIFTILCLKPLKEVLYYSGARAGASLAVTRREVFTLYTVETIIYSYCTIEFPPSTQTHATYECSRIASNSFSFREALFEVRFRIYSAGQHGQNHTFKHL